MEGALAVLIRLLFFQYVGKILKNSFGRVGHCTGKFNFPDIVIYIGLFSQILELSCYY